MKFKGRPVQPSRVDLPMLQTWLEKLLELPSPPTVEECSQGTVLLAALHHISSNQPLVSQRRLRSGRSAVKAPQPHSRNAAQLSLASCRRRFPLHMQTC